MMKRMIPLVAIAIVFFTFTPSAQADCFQCTIVPAPELRTCYVLTSGPLLGWTECYDDEFGCHRSGDRCTASPSAMTSLAADYSVASVERLDEPTTPTLVTTLEEPATTR